MRAVSTKLGSIDAETIMNGSYVVETHKSDAAGSGGSYGLRSFVSKRSQNLRSLGSTKSVALVSRRESQQGISAVHETGKNNNDSNNDSGAPGGPRIYQGDQFSNIAQVFSEGRVDAQSIGHDSNDSTRMIIKKEVQWTVESDKNTVDSIHTAATTEEPADHIMREDIAR